MQKYLMARIFTTITAYEADHSTSIFAGCLPKILLGTIFEYIVPFVFSFTKFYTNLSQFSEIV